MAQLPSYWDLPDEIRRRFGEKSSGKQRAMAAQGHLLLVMHKAPNKDQRDRKAAFFWRNPAGQWLSESSSEGLAALQRHVKEYDKLEAQLDAQYQKAADSEDYFDILEHLGPLKHAAANMHNTLQAAREAVTDDKDIIDLRDQAASIERNLALLQDDCKNALDYTSAQKAAEQAQFGRLAAQAGHRLNILAAVFFPLTAIAGIFGMNLRSGLEQAPKWVFWAIFIAGACLGIIIHNWVTHRGARSR